MRRLPALLVAVGLVSVAAVTVVAVALIANGSDPESEASTASDAPRSVPIGGSEARAAPETPVSEASEPVASEDAPGPSEGIKVHGSWTIDVLEPDGTLVSHVEFQNALLVEAADLLVLWLADGSNTNIGTEQFWHLFLGNTELSGFGVPSCSPNRDLSPTFGGLSPFISPSNFVDQGCIIVSPEFLAFVDVLPTDLPPGWGGDLETILSFEAGPNIFRLRGSVVADQDGTIDIVQSFWTALDPGTIVIDVIDFTSRVLDDPIAVVVGQTIEVQFDLSFE